MNLASRYDALKPSDIVKVMRENNVSILNSWPSVPVTCPAWTRRLYDMVGCCACRFLLEDSTSGVCLLLPNTQ